SRIPPAPLPASPREDIPRTASAFGINSAGRMLPMRVRMGDVSLLLVAASEGDRGAADQAFALVYSDLQRLARRQVRQSGDGVGATSLAHEGYLRLVRPDALQLRSREPFFALAARAMRQLVIDHARQRTAAKRGGGAAPASLTAFEERVGELGDAE